MPVYTIPARYAKAATHEEFNWLRNPKDQRYIDVQAEIDDPMTPWLEDKAIETFNYANV